MGTGVRKLNLIISDKPIQLNFHARESIQYIDLTQLKIANCIGCFGCWVKTPGKCIIRDDATKVYPLIAKSKRLLYVSKIRYGSYDIPMKTMLERSIPIQKAFIRLVHGETHHVQRNVIEKDATIIAYGDTSQEEQELFKRLVSRNASNMMFKSWNVRFIQEDTIMEQIQKEIRQWERS